MKHFEKIERDVIAAYDAGELDRTRLDELCEPYRGKDMNFSEGWQSLTTQDDKNVVQVMIEAFGLEHPVTRPKEEGEEDYDLDTEHEIFIDKQAKLYDQVTHHYGWIDR